jgi:hypothetical protein
MKLGLELYPRLPTVENLAFAKQIGVSHIVADLVCATGYRRAAITPVEEER